MKQLKQFELQELTDKVYDLVAKTNIELGYNTDGKTMAVLSKSFAHDLTTEVRFSKLYFEDIVEAFRLGVRYNEEKQFLNIPTFYKWTLKHKRTIDEATYQVRTLNAPPENVKYYRDTKLLTTKTK